MHPGMKCQPEASHTSCLAEHDRRFFIITSGRTGSSLLSAILADAGSDFGMDPPQHWDPGSGEMEHSDAISACRWLRAAHEISDVGPCRGIGQYRWRFLNSLGKRYLHAALGKARFLKVVDGHFLVRAAFKLGYFPSVILSYRRFEEFALSSSMMVTNTNLARLAQQYNRANLDGLLLLNTFGGCAISYDQLVDSTDNSWINSLASLTNISPNKLIAARDKRVISPQHNRVQTVFDASARYVFDAIEAIHGSVVPPSPPALRSWRGRQSISVPCARPNFTARASLGRVLSLMSPNAS